MADEHDTGRAGGLKVEVGADIDALNGFDAAAAKANTAELTAKLEKAGLTGVEFMRGGIDPNRQNAVWFLPADRRMVMTASYRGFFILMLAYPAIPDDCEVTLGNGDKLDLGDESALPSVGIYDDADLDRAMRDGRLDTYGRAYFNVVAWKEGDNSFSHFFDQMDEFSAGRAHSRAKTVIDAITMGVIVCMMDIDRHCDGKPNLREGAGDGAQQESGGSGLEVDAVDFDAAVASLAKDAIDVEYDGPDGAVARIRVGEAAKRYAGVMFGDAVDTFYLLTDDEGADFASAMASALPDRMRGSSGFVEGFIKSQIGEIAYNMSTTIGVADGGDWRFAFETTYMFDTAFEPDIVTDPDGIRCQVPDDNVCLALALLVGDADSGIVRAIASVHHDDAVGQVDTDYFCAKVRGYARAIKVVRDGVYSIPDDCEGFTRAALNSRYIDEYAEASGKGIEIRFSKPIEELRDSMMNSSTIMYSGKVGALELPDGLKRLGDEALRGFGMRRVLIPKTVTHIGEDVFRPLPHPIHRVIAFEGDRGEYPDSVVRVADSYPKTSAYDVRWGVSREAFRSLTEELDDGGPAGLEVNAAPAELSGFLTPNEIKGCIYKAYDGRGGEVYAIWQDKLEGILMESMYGDASLPDPHDRSAANEYIERRTSIVQAANQIIQSSIPGDLYDYHEHNLTSPHVDLCLIARTGRGIVELCESPMFLTDGSANGRMVGNADDPYILLALLLPEDEEMVRAMARALALARRLRAKDIASEEALMGRVADYARVIGVLRSGAVSCPECRGIRVSARIGESIRECNRALGFGEGSLKTLALTFSEKESSIDEPLTAEGLIGDSVSSVEFPDGTREIGVDVFICIGQSLRAVYLPESVERFDFYFLPGKPELCLEAGPDSPLARSLRTTIEMASMTDSVTLRFGVTREQFRAMLGNHALDEDLQPDSGLEVIAAPDELLRPDWAAGKDRHMADIRGRLEACGYGDVEFLQDVCPGRDDAEWYCRSGCYDGVIAFSGRDGLEFRIIAGGDHAVYIDGEAYDDMSELEAFGIYDDDTLSQIYDIAGEDSTFEGLCEFEIEVSDASGWAFSTSQLNEPIGCTLSEALDFVTDPGSMDWFVEEFRRYKEENARLAEGGARREQFRATGDVRASAESLTEDEDGDGSAETDSGLTVDALPNERIPMSEGIEELVAFLTDVYGSAGAGDDNDFVVLGGRVYNVQHLAGRDIVPLVYGQDADGWFACRLTFPSDDAEAAAAELLTSGIEPDGIDSMLGQADEMYDMTREDSLPELIDSMCDLFGIRKYAGYDDWKSQSGR